MSTAAMDDRGPNDSLNEALYGLDSGVHVRLLCPGERVAGKYLIHGKLGQGGFSVVYDAEHLGLGRRVALKIVHLGDETPRSLLERARREARISALVRHRNVLEVFDTGVLEDGSPYLVMERIQGENLAERIARGPLTIAAVVELARQLLSALDAIAQKGIIHRDIKSENVMLHDPGDGRLVVKVVDFGISKRTGRECDTRLTSNGQLIGTPSYMSPEQLRGEDIDTRTDIYAAGVVLYEALTGHVPHERTNLTELMLAALHDKVRPVRQLRPSCPRELERIVMKAIARSREERYQTAREMLDELERFATACDLPKESKAWHAVEAIELSHHEQSAWEKLRRFGDELEAKGLVRRGAQAGLIVCLLAVGVMAARLYPHTNPETVVIVRPAELPTPPVAYAEPKPLVTPLADTEPRLLKLERDFEDERVETRTREGDAVASVPAFDDGSASAATQEQRVRVRRSRPLSNRAKSAVDAETPPDDARVFAMRVEAHKSPEELMDEALAAYALGRYALTERLYRQAVRLAPDMPAAWRGLGLVAARQGDTEQARTAFTKYLALAPNAPDADAIRARIKALPTRR